MFRLFGHLFKKNSNLDLDAIGNTQRTSMEAYIHKSSLEKLFFAKVFSKMNQEVFEFFGDNCYIYGAVPLLPGEYSPDLA